MDHNHDKKRKLRVAFLYVMYVFILFQVTCVDARGDIADDIFLTVKEEYPLEIKTLRRFGASETDLKAFISAFENSVSIDENINANNFDKGAADIIMVLYLSGEHLNVFDGVFNGWGLEVEDLINAMNNGGAQEVMDMLPESFSAIARMVKEILMETIWSCEIKGSVIIPETDDFSGFSVLINGKEDMILNMERGEFLLNNISEGGCQLVFQKKGFLSKKVFLNAKRGQINDIGEIRMIWGDFNGDSLVDIYDLVSMVKMLHQSPDSGKEIFDYNLDGIIDINDFHRVVVNYNRIGD